MRKDHPNIYETVELFQWEEAVVEVTTEQLQAGGIPKKKKKKSCDAWRGSSKFERRIFIRKNFEHIYIDEIKHFLISFDY